MSIDSSLRRRQVIDSQPQPPNPKMAVDSAGVGSETIREGYPKKSPFTCATCRSRKVRCNGAKPICSNCRRLTLPCSYNETDADNWTVTLPRRRVRQACITCHSRKARCSGHMPSCDRCRHQGIECVYPSVKRSRNSNRLSSDNSSHFSSSWAAHQDAGEDSDPSLTDPASAHTPSTCHNDGPSLDESFDSIVQKTFEQFFHHVHHIPMFSFFHRASLMEQYHAGKADKALLLALVGITSCFIDMGPGIQEYGHRCVDEAESRVLAEYAVPSTIKVQTLVLIIKHRILNNRFPRAFMLFSTASRFATVLRLNHENPSLCFLAKESRQRLMWSLYCLDIFISGGYEEFSLWRADRIHVGLPCNERNFEFDLAQPTEKLIISTVDQPQQPHAEGVASLALHIRILYIRQKINEFTKTALLNRRIGAVELQAGILALQGELEDFASRLPVSFQFSENSLRLRAYSPRICIFVMIHIWWRQCHCDLYRLALTDFRDALPKSTFDSFDAGFLNGCQQSCVEHALAMANIFSCMQKLNAKPVADLELAVCATQCARMLQYSYKLDAAKFHLSAEDVLSQSRVCLEAIRQCCRGSTARMIGDDLEHSIMRGLSSDSTSPMLLGQNSSIHNQHGTMLSLALPAHPGLRDIQVGDEPTVIGSPFQTSCLSPTTDQACSNTAITSPAWSMSPSGYHHLNGTAAALTSPSIGLKAMELAFGNLPTQPDAEVSVAPPEVNNAYEGALEGLGLDNGLDHAMGVADASRMWVSPSMDWMAQTGFATGQQQPWD